MKKYFDKAFVAVGIFLALSVGVVEVLQDPKSVPEEERRDGKR